MIFYWFVQNVIVQPLTWLILPLFFKIEIRGQKNFKKINGPFIIASNHKTLIDGFLIGMAFPWFSKLAPLRYMTEQIKFRGPILEFFRRIKFLQFFYLLTGGFDSKRGQGIDKAIEYPAKLLKKKCGSVLMFPEGKLVRENELGQFFHGSSALILASRVLVLPVFISVGKKKRGINIGEPFFMPKVSREEATNILKEKISALR